MNPFPKSTYSKAEESPCTAVVRHRKKKWRAAHGCRLRGLSLFPRPWLCRVANRYGGSEAGSRALRAGGRGQVLLFPCMAHVSDMFLPRPSTATLFGRESPRRWPPTGAMGGTMDQADRAPDSRFLAQPHPSSRLWLVSRPAASPPRPSWSIRGSTQTRRPAAARGRPSIAPATALQRRSNRTRPTMPPPYPPTSRRASSPADADRLACQQPRSRRSPRVRASNPARGPGLLLALPLVLFCGAPASFRPTTARLALLLPSPPPLPFRASLGCAQRKATHLFPFRRCSQLVPDRALSELTRLPRAHQASWAAYLAGTSARLLTSLTGVDFQPTRGAQASLQTRSSPRGKHTTSSSLHPPFPVTGKSPAPSPPRGSPRAAPLCLPSPICAS
jgi:hypothetical protein